MLQLSGVCLGKMNKTKQNNPEREVLGEMDVGYVALVGKTP